MSTERLECPRCGFGPVQTTDYPCHDCLIAEVAELKAGHAARDAEVERLRGALVRIDTKSLIGLRSTAATALLQDIQNIARQVLTPTEPSEADKPKPPMVYNTCKTCGANNGRAGNLINGECLNCYDTRRTGNAVIHAELRRTSEEMRRTFAILSAEPSEKTTV